MCSKCLKANDVNQCSPQEVKMKEKNTSRRPISVLLDCKLTFGRKEIGMGTVLYPLIFNEGGEEVLRYIKGGYKTRKG